MTSYQRLAVQAFRSKLIALLLIVSGALSISVAPAATPESEPSTPTSVPLPNSGPIKLVAVPEASPPREGQSPVKWQSKGFIPVAFKANKTFAMLGDLDVFEMRNRLYTVQVRDPGGYVLTDVTNPAEPDYPPGDRGGQL